MVLVMSGRGRRPAYSREQRERVLALAAEGRGQRQIAEQVFGDVRYRGRVERILKLPPTRNIGSGQAPGEGNDLEVMLAAGEDMAIVAELVARYELESDVAPSLVEIERLLRIKRQLAGMATLKRLKALTCRPSESTEADQRGQPSSSKNPAAAPVPVPDGGAWSYRNASPANPKVDRT